MKKCLYLFLSLLIISGCSGDSDDTDPCANAANIDLCEGRTKQIDVREATLNLNFTDSYLFDNDTLEWLTVSSSNLDGGLVGLEVPIYSSILSLSPEQALDRVSLAKEQFENQNNFPQSEYSIIPYIEVEFEQGVEYVYEYKKRTLEGEQVASYIGKFLTKDNRAFLPFVNSMFGNQFYSNNEEIGTRYIHTLKVTAQSPEGQGARTATIEFQSVLKLPLIDFFVDYSSTMDDFNLKDRMKFYYSGSDGIANQNFQFLSLRERDEPEAVPTDVRILFKERPTIKITQDIFSEFPFDLNKIKTGEEPTVIRGQSFYQRRVVLDSTDDFRMKVIMNGVQQNLANGREFLVEGLPAGVRWDLDFIIDFSQNPAYQGNGQPLITPYKPTCQQEKNENFFPLALEEEKEILQANEGLFVYCNYETGGTLRLTKNQLAAAGDLDTRDTFFQYFNYMPLNEGRNEAGHFDGIRQVTFSLEGCMRVFAKTPTSDGFELKSEANVACQDETDQDGDGWVYFSASKTYTINDDIDEYAGTTGLVPLIQTMGSKSPLTTPHFDFNGLKNNTNHIY